MRRDEPREQPDADARPREVFEMEAPDLESLQIHARGARLNMDLAGRTLTQPLVARSAATAAA
jgi:hypothetical protein